MKRWGGFLQKTQDPNRVCEPTLSETKIAIVMNLVKPEAAAKRELLIQKSISGLFRKLTHVKELQLSKIGTKYYQSDSLHPLIARCKRANANHPPDVWLSRPTGRNLP